MQSQDIEKYIQEFSENKRYDKKTVTKLLKSMYNIKDMPIEQFQYLAKLHGIYFYKKPSIISLIMLKQDGDAIYILFVRAQNGDLQLPGGRIDPAGLGGNTNKLLDETPITAMQREFSEEVGLQLQLVCNEQSSLQEKKYIQISGNNKIYTYINIYITKNSKILSQYETIERIWINIQDIFDNNDIPQRYKVSIYKTLKKMYQTINNTQTRPVKIDKENIQSICQDMIKIIPQSIVA